MLDALPSQERVRITERCDPVELSQGQVITKPGALIREVYFPTDSIFVRMARATPRGAIGAGLIGNEGVVGVSLALGIGIAPLHVSVVESGKALRMSSTEFKRLSHESPLLERQLQLYLCQQLSQAHQAVACAVFHVVEKRLAYWLLMLHDRVRAERIHLTHDRLASILGVRRSGVSTAAGLLQRRKVISYSRGNIVILNRKGLEKVACGCYRKGRTMAKQIAAAHKRDEDVGIIELSVAS